MAKADGNVYRRHTPPFSFAAQFDPSLLESFAMTIKQVILRTGLVLFAAASTAPAQTSSAKFVGFRDVSGRINCSSDSGTDGTSTTNCSTAQVRVYDVRVGPVRYELEESNMKAAIPYAGLFLKHGPLHNQSPGTPIVVSLDGAFMRVAGAKGKDYRYRIVSAHSD